MYIHSLLIQDRLECQRRECILTILSPFKEVQDTMNKWIFLGSDSYQQMIETLSNHYFSLIDSEILETKTFDINTSSLLDRIEVEGGSRLYSFAVGPLYELTKTYDDETVDYAFAWSVELFPLE